jgi:hypothetical protein
MPPKRGWSYPFFTWVRTKKGYDPFSGRVYRFVLWVVLINDSWHSGAAVFV